MAAPMINDIKRLDNDQPMSNDHHNTANSNISHQPQGMQL
jgi:hypothetical protein